MKQRVHITTLELYNELFKRYWILQNLKQNKYLRKKTYIRGSNIINTGRHLANSTFKKTVYLAFCHAIREQSSTSSEYNKNLNEVILSFENYHDSLGSFYTIPIVALANTLKHF